jgi:hypothetical protein
VREKEGVERTKVKYTHSSDTLTNPFEHLLNINEMQNYKKGAMRGGGYLWERRGCRKRLI